jgi:hypothetical protein
VLGLLAVGCVPIAGDSWDAPPPQRLDAGVTIAPSVGAGAGGPACPLEGEEEGPGAAVLELSLSTLDLGQVALGQPVLARPIYLRNRGCGLTGSVSIAVAGGDFRLWETPCTLPLAAGESCGVMVQFDARTPGVHRATLWASATPGGMVHSDLLAEVLEGTGGQDPIR